MYQLTTSLLPYLFNKVFLKAPLLFSISTPCLSHLESRHVKPMCSSVLYIVFYIIHTREDSVRLSVGSAVSLSLFVPYSKIPKM